MYVVTGSPVEPFADAVRAALTADAVLMALIAGGVLTATKLRTPTPFPYAVISRQEMGASDAAMQTEGGQVALTIDVWSAANGSHETQQIQSAIRRVLHRRNIAIVGFELVRGSLTCEEELAFSDSDPDIPEDALFHGVQRWVAYVEEIPA